MPLGFGLDLINCIEINPNSTYPLSEPSVDQDTKTMKENFSLPQGFEPRAPNIESHSATNELP